MLDKHPELESHPAAAARVFAMIALAEQARGRPLEAREWLAKARRRRRLSPHTLVSALAVRGGVSPDRLLAGLALFARSM
jgi:hypothetical protein